MLLGAEIHIHIDHKNILNVGDSSKKSLRWILYVDKYSSTLHYVEGPRNVIADTFSKLSHQDYTSALVGKKAIAEDIELANYSLFDDKEIFDCLMNLPCLNCKKQKHLKARTLVTQYNKKCPRDTDIKQHCHHQICHRDTDTSWHHRHQNHCLHNVTPDQFYLNLPEDMVEDNYLDIENIKEKQDEDNELQQSATRHPEWYSCKTFSNVDNVLCYTKTGGDPSNWKIALPNELIRSTVNWYHQVTGHPVSKRLYEQICQRYHNRDLQRYIDNFNCEFVKGII
jgi:hypothetical protein